MEEKIKKCSKCEIIKNIINFRKNKKGKYGVTSICKICLSNIEREKRLKNPEKTREANRKSYRKNIEKFIERRKKIDKEQLRKSYALYRKRHGDKLKEIGRLYRIKNKEKISIKKKKYAEENKEIINRYQRQYRKKYYNNKPHLAIWRSILKRTLKFFKTKKHDKSINILGYTPQQLKQRIEFQFKEGMSWSNYGKWHIDHKKPVSLFDAETPVHIVNALSNLQPLWAKDNLSKGKKFT